MLNNYGWNRTSNVWIETLWCWPDDQHGSEKSFTSRDYVSSDWFFVLVTTCFPKRFSVSTWNDGFNGTVSDIFVCRRLEWSLEIPCSWHCFLVWIQDFPHRRGSLNDLERDYLLERQNFDLSYFLYILKTWKRKITPNGSPWNFVTCCQTSDRILQVWLNNFSKTSWMTCGIWTGSTVKPITKLKSVHCPTSRIRLNVVCLSWPTQNRSWALLKLYSRGEAMKMRY